MTRREEDDMFKTLNFQYFEPLRDIIKSGVKNAAITLVGARRRGKSVLIRDLYYKIGHYYSEVYLFSGTADAQLDFWNFIPKKNIFQGVNETELERIWDSQKKVINSSKETDKKKMPHVLIIFDDVIQDNTGVRSSEFICKMYSNGRHLNICSILATQSFKKVSKHARDNTDITIAYNFKNGDDKDDFVRENISTVSPRLGKKILDSITCNQDYHCIIALNYINSLDTTQMIKKYLAEENPKPRKESRKVIIASAKESLYKISPSTYEFQ